MLKNRRESRLLGRRMGIGDDGVVSQGGIMRRQTTSPQLGRSAASAAVAIAAIAAIASSALAAAPVKGGRYSGRVNITATLTVRFKVSGSGKKVTSLKVSPALPNSCGFGGPPPAQSARAAKVRKGKFTTKITEKTSGGTVTATARVKGRFLAGGKEKGRIITNVPGNTSCNGSFRYSTEAQTAS
jgi:hypothetical protein